LRRTASTMSAARAAFRAPTRPARLPGRTGRARATALDSGHSGGPGPRTVPAPLAAVHHSQPRSRTAGEISRPGGMIGLREPAYKRGITACPKPGPIDRCCRRRPGNSAKGPHRVPGCQAAKATKTLCAAPGTDCACDGAGQLPADDAGWACWAPMGYQHRRIAICRGRRRLRLLPSLRRCRRRCTGRGCRAPGLLSRRVHACPLPGPIRLIGHRTTWLALAAGQRLKMTRIGQWGGSEYISSARLRRRPLEWR
jgi:hypothetical protein